MTILDNQIRFAMFDDAAIEAFGMLVSTYKDGDEALRKEILPYLSQAAGALAARIGMLNVPPDMPKDARHHLRKLLGVEAA